MQRLLKGATSWFSALSRFSIYQLLVWQLPCDAEGKLAHLSLTFVIMTYKSKAWVYQISSGVWRIGALDGCSTETSLHHRLFSALCQSYFLYSPCHFLPWDAMLEMPQAVQTRSSMITWKYKSKQIWPTIWILLVKGLWEESQFDPSCKSILWLQKTAFVVVSFETSGREQHEHFSKLHLSTESRAIIYITDFLPTSRWSGAFWLKSASLSVSMWMRTTVSSHTLKHAWCLWYFQCLPFHCIHP